MTTRIPLRLVVLAIIATLQVFSAVFTVPGLGTSGGSFFRLALAAAGVVLFFATGLRLISPVTQRALAVSALLTLWMTVSLTWSPEFILGLQQVSYVATTLVLIYVLDVLILDEDDLSRVGLWIAILGALIMVASFYEITSGFHFFRSSLQDAAEINRSLSYISDDLAWFSFDNPNDLAVHLAACGFVATPVLARSGWGRLLLLLYVGASVVLFEMLDARIVIVAVVLFLVLYFLAGLQASARTVFLMFVGVLAGVLVVLATLLAFADAAELLDVSTFIRLELVKSAIVMGERTNLIGIGSGAFESEMWSQGFVGATYGIINPHNAVSRMFAENGAIGLIALGFLLLGPALVLRQNVRIGSLTSFIAAGTIGFLLLFSVGSNPIGASTLQMMIAYLWVARRVIEQRAMIDRQRTSPTGLDRSWEPDSVFGEAGLSSGRAG